MGIYCARARMAGLMTLVIFMHMGAAQGAHHDVPAEPAADQAVRAEASLVVYGEIGSLSYHEGEDGTIYTFAELEPLHNYRGGNASEPIPIITGGGINPDGQQVHYSDNAEFHAGQRAVAYLVPFRDRYAPARGGRGFFPFENGIANGGGGSPCSVATYFCQTGRAWREEDLPLPWNYNASGQALSTAQTTVQSAFNEWQSDANSYLSFSYGGTTTAGFTHGDGINSVSWAGGTCGGSSDWKGCAETVVGTGCSDYFLCILELDIKFKSGISWSTALLKEVAMHEVGHGIGLHHASGTGQVMYDVADGTLTTLASGDRRGAQLLYPAAQAFTYGGGGGWWSSPTYLASNVYHTQSGFFDGDSLTDVAAMYSAVPGSTSWQVWLSTGTSFSMDPLPWFSTSGYTAASVVQSQQGDFDGDGDTDLAALYTYGSGAAWHVWLTTGTSFVYQTSLGWWKVDSGYSTSGVRQSAAGDFNNDGKTDLATLFEYLSGEDRWHVWLSTGSSFDYQTGNGWWQQPTGYSASSLKHAFGGRLDSTGLTATGPADITGLYNTGASGARWHAWLSTGSSFTYQGGAGWWDTAAVPYPASQALKAASTDLGADGLVDVAVLYDDSPSAAMHAWRPTGGKTATAACGSQECPALVGQEWWRIGSGYSAASVRHMEAGRFNSGSAGDVATLYDYGTSAAWHVWTGKN